MPLTMNCDGRRARPGIICDFCLKDIKDVKDGNAQWIAGDEGKGAGCRIYFTHKQCCHAFEAANPADWGAQELAHYLVFLANNLKTDWDEAKAGAKRIASIG
jgi:hypothetical protein